MSWIIFTHLINIPSVPNVRSVKSNFIRNRLSSAGTSAESHSHPFQLMDGVEDETETASAEIAAFPDIFLEILKQKSANGKE
jgi:hypothetical protein